MANDSRATSPSAAATDALVRSPNERGLNVRSDVRKMARATVATMRRSPSAARPAANTSPIITAPQRRALRIALSDVETLGRR